MSVGFITKSGKQLQKKDHTLLLTGLPRSGTTLVCRLLHAQENVVALNEPFVFRAFELGSLDDITEFIESQLNAIRIQILEERKAPSLQKKGNLPENNFTEFNGHEKIRRLDAQHGYISISQKVNKSFFMCVKHNVAFTALLPHLITLYPVVAVIRNPLALILSWNSLESPLSEGRSPLGERLDPLLSKTLSNLTCRIQRQVVMINWFFERFQLYVSPGQIVRYEEIIHSGGNCLSEVFPSFSTHGINIYSGNSQYHSDREEVIKIKDILLQTGGPYLYYYSRDEISFLSDLLTYRL